MLIRHGFSGTREGMNDFQRDFVRSIFYRAYGMVGDHGDCTGSDEEAHRMMLECAYQIRIHPPINPKNRAYCGGPCCTILPPKDYLPRNIDIIHDTDCLIATPKSIVPEYRGSGTWHAIRYAQKLERPVMIVWPNGTTTAHNWDVYEGWIK